MRLSKRRKRGRERREREGRTEGIFFRPLSLTRAHMHMRESRGKGEMINEEGEGDDYAKRVAAEGAYAWKEEEEEGVNKERK